MRPPPISTLFPYTTLFRSQHDHAVAEEHRLGDRVGDEQHRHAALQPHALQLDRQRLARSEEHTSELQSRRDLVCRLLLEKKTKNSPLSHATFMCNRHTSTH